MQSAQSVKCFKWTDISKPIFLSCVAVSAFGSILWRRSKESRHSKEMQENKNIKLGCGRILPDNSEVDLEAVHEFYNAVQESSLLYPYFMHVKVDKRKNVMQNIACLFYKTLQNDFSQNVSTRLRNIHKKLNVTDNAYNQFTKLFAHICCENKSEELRARMPKAFSELRSEICLASVIHPVDLTSFFEFIADSCTSTKYLNSQVKNRVETLANQVKNDPKNKPYLISCPRASTKSLVLERAKAWKKRIAQDDIEKKIMELEIKVSQLVNVSNDLYARIEAVEEQHNMANHKSSCAV